MNKPAMRKPPEAAFFHLKKRIPDPAKVSLRKQMCLAYLEWRTRHTDELKLAWVELTIEFRKVEGRVGMKRTKLEKLARRHFTQRRRKIKNSRSREAATEFARKQFEEGTGIHTPERVAQRAEIAREWIRKRNEENNHPGVRDWIITQKDGPVFRIRNLRKFCRDHEINYRNLHFTAVSNWWAKGYRARKFDPLTDENIPWQHELEGFG